METKKSNVLTLPGKNGGAFSVSRFIYESIQYDPKATIASGGDLNEKKFELGSGFKGGMIILSTEVNAISQSQSKVVNWVKQKFESIKNQLELDKKVNKVAMKHPLHGWTVGKYLHGKYTSMMGTPYSEASLSIMLIGITSEHLIEFAEDLCAEFKQESVLVQDYNTGGIYFVSPDKTPEEAD